jgi:hypothetical protein
MLLICHAVRRCHLPCAMNRLRALSSSTPPRPWWACPEQELPTDPTKLDRELDTADQAVDQAFQCLLDVLEDAQKGTLSLHKEWVQRCQQLHTQVQQLQSARGKPPAWIVTTNKSP